ncbi:molybdenum cofactor guanylyltransferase [Pseudoalteromonas sp. SSM20]|uniref:molybdenum cofactor guanylyltransferase n=1 Tax=Pseudoalteromonas sp. SSM20 TaxID=3139394 RepID=UPI003BA95071
MEIVGLVLAGGKSSRMGQDKAELRFGDQNLLDHAIETLSDSLCQRVLVSRNKGNAIKDRFIGLGPLAGIDAAVVGLNNGIWLSVLPVDMPLVNSAHLIALQHYSLKQQQACYFEGFMLPCVLQINNALRVYLANSLSKQKSLSLRALLKALNAKPLASIRPDLLINTNTPEQWRSLETTL